jgi:hypothetical protein
VETIQYSPAGPIDWRIIEFVLALLASLLAFLSRRLFTNSVEQGKLVSTIRL